MLYLARRMLGYGADKWRALAWWQRRAYTEGIVWELENGGLYPQRVVAGEGGGGGERRAEQTFVPLNDLDARAAEGIQTSVIYQDAP